MPTGAISHDPASIYQVLGAVLGLHLVAELAQQHEGLRAVQLVGTRLEDIAELAVVVGTGQVVGPHGEPPVMRGGAQQTRQALDHALRAGPSVLGKAVLQLAPDSHCFAASLAASSPASST